jgi:hypothetical protein
VRSRSSGGSGGSKERHTHTASEPLITELHFDPTLRQCENRLPTRPIETIVATSIMGPIGEPHERRRPTTINPFVLSPWARLLLSPVGSNWRWPQKSKVKIINRRESSASSYSPASGGYNRTLKANFELSCWVHELNSTSQYRNRLNARGWPASRGQAGGPLTDLRADEACAFDIIE